jgi:hypothetical protein
MTTHHKDACRCGSGKRYKHCHLPADQARARRGWIAGIGAIALLLVAGAAWGVYSRWQEARLLEGGGGGDSLRTQGVVAGGMPAGSDVSGAGSPAPQGAFGGISPGGRNAQAPLPASPGGSIPMGQSSSQALQPGENPTPWQYDVARNRHYDPRPGHMHWHNGAPPADTSNIGITTTGGSNPTVSVGGSGNVTVTPSGGSGLTPNVTTRTTPITSAGSTPLAPGENPAPWEYDKAKDRHFDPRDAHRHWHAGPPPAVSERGK